MTALTTEDRKQRSLIENLARAVLLGILYGVIATLPEIFNLLRDNRYLSIGLDRAALATALFVLEGVYSRAIPVILGIGIVGWAVKFIVRRPLRHLTPFLVLTALLSVTIAYLVKGGWHISMPRTTVGLIGMGALAIPLYMAFWFPGGFDSKLKRWFGRLLWSVPFLCTLAYLVGEARWWSLLHLESARYPDVVMITVDTLRADHLGCYGYKRKISPRMDALAADGVLYERAYSQIPATSPSHASMFTGLYPGNHPVLDNNYLGYSLPRRFTTLAEILLDSGYQTGAVVGALTTNSTTGLDQGFLTYDDDFRYERKAGTVTSRAIQWYQSASSRGDGNAGPPRFLWVHYFDPHGPYRPPIRYRNLFPDHEAPRILPEEMLPQYQRIPNVKNGNVYVDRYDSEIRYTDEEIGKLLDSVLYDRKKRHKKPVLVMLTADHGESLMDRSSFFDHGGFVYEEEVRVPLIFAGEWSFLTGDEGETAARRVTAPAASIDLFPTLLRELGLSSPYTPDGEPLSGNEFAADRPIFFESARCDSRKDPSCAPEGTSGKQYGVLWGDLKLIRNSLDSGFRAEFYDLASEWGERKPLPLTNPSYEGLRTQLLRWRESLKYYPKDMELELEPQIEEGLRALGYVE